MKDLHWLLAILFLFLLYHFVIGPMTTHRQYPKETDYLPAKLQKGYNVDSPFTEEEEEDEEDDPEPEPYLVEPHHSLGRGKIPEYVKAKGQVYDAQSESYYRGENGCDVFVN